jgi:large subunit ribosomal protein L24
MKLQIRKGATVQVISGDDKGKKGAVLDINPKKMRLLVQGVKMVTRHDKKEGLIKKEAYIHYSNVKMIEAAAKKEPKKKASKSKSA